MKWLTGLFCLLVSAVAAGCGGDGSEKKSETTPASSGEKVTLTVWDWSVPPPEAMAKVDAAFTEEHPNITIERVQHPADTFQALLRSAFASKKGPDVFLSFASPYALDFENGIQPLGEYLTDEDYQKVDGYKQSANSEGEPLVAPLDGNGVVFYYDKAKFAKAGIDSPPKTWNDLVDSCEKLKQAGITPIVAGFKDGGMLQLLMAGLAPQYMSDEETVAGVQDPDWEHPAMEQSLAKIQDLFNRECFTPGSEGIVLFPDTVNNFKAGKGAMMLGFEATDVHWGIFRETKWGKKGLGTFMMPYDEEGNWDAPRMNYAASSGYAIAKASDHPAEAAEYVRYINSAPAQEMLFAEAGVFPVNRDAKVNVTDPVAGQILEWIKTEQHYAGQLQLARANVEVLLLRYVPQLITGEKSWGDIAPELTAEQEKSER
jgi:ABC-type glycerol-3-phosphate transport system substrate-binding protein